MSAFSGTAMINYYVRDFSFGASIASPARDLIDSQISRKTFWRYQLSAMWNHGNWAIEANANNLFMMKNNNGSLKFEITTKRLYAASQRVL